MHAFSQVDVVPMQMPPVQQPVEAHEPLGTAHGQATPETQTLEPLFNGTQHPPAHWEEPVQVVAQ